MLTALIVSTQLFNISDSEAQVVRTGAESFLKMVSSPLPEKWTGPYKTHPTQTLISLASKSWTMEIGSITGTVFAGINKEIDRKRALLIFRDEKPCVDSEQAAKQLIQSWSKKLKFSPTWDLKKVEVVLDTQHNSILGKKTVYGSICGYFYSKDGSENGKPDGKIDLDIASGNLVLVARKTEKRSYSVPKSRKPVSEIRVIAKSKAEKLFHQGIPDANLEVSEVWCESKDWNFNYGPDGTAEMVRAYMTIAHDLKGNEFRAYYSVETGERIDRN